MVPVSEGIKFVWTAQPSTYLLSPTGPEADADIPGFYRRAVVGWALHESGTVYPITINGVEETSDRVLFQNGPVQGFDDEFCTVADFVKAVSPRS